MGRMHPRVVDSGVGPWLVGRHRPRGGLPVARPERPKSVRVLQVETDRCTEPRAHCGNREPTGLGAKAIPDRVGFMPSTSADQSTRRGVSRRTSPWIASGEDRIARNQTWDRASANARAKLTGASIAARPRPRIVQAVVRVSVLIIGGFLAAPVASAAPARLVIQDGLDLPPHMADFHDRMRSALASVATEKGRQIVISSGHSSCTTPACFRDVAHAAGAAEILTVAGGRNEYEGWHLEIGLRRKNGELRVNEAGGCNVCSGSEMVDSARKLAVRVFDQAPVEVAPLDQSASSSTTHPSGIPVRHSALGIAGPGGTRAPDAGHLARDGGIAGAGILATGAGIYLWWLNGTGVDCESGPVSERVCPVQYRTARIGIPLVTVGLAIAVMGAIAISRDLRLPSTSVAIGPGALALEGSF